MAGPAGTSPAALFLRRTLTGRWDVAARAAVVPALWFVALAVVISVWSGASVHHSGVDFLTRTRVALALLLTGIGGRLDLTTRFENFPDSGSAFGDSYGSSGLSDSSFTTLHSTFSVTALAMSLLWVGSLFVALRRMRTRATGAGAGAGAGAEGANPPAEAARWGAAEAAVRVALLAAATALVLGLAARPHVREEHLTTRPALLTLWAFLISLATALLTLCAPDVRRWLAERPGLAATTRALVTALLALLVTVALAGAVVFVVVGADVSDTSGWGVAFAALFVLNLGVSGLGLGWGAPFRMDANNGSGSSSHFSYGLSDLGHVWHGWATAGAVAGGLVCALVLGVLAVRRSADRLEQFLVAGLFTALFTALTAFGGLSTDGAGTLVAVGAGSGHITYATSVPEALMFALLWSCGGVLVGPYVARALRGFLPAPVPGAHAPGGTAAGTGADPGGVAHLLRPPRQPAVPAPPMPGRPPLPPQGGPVEPTVHDLGIVQPPRLNEPPGPGKPPGHR
ncbi:hypothetical protein [Actinacidiphila acidipaludis]|uniref:Integral membrane protein n=1 Tax=Actinacidiphila acidipaludis TaxID=2873382 RepID=A0ABS7Q4R7_9ACTN|nr:hypothetical protein [Streptomyces acidipaludis]MBY8878151.1 hypothetical protein [Streptomyces acidipaludis]